MRNQQIIDAYQYNYYVDKLSLKIVLLGILSNFSTDVYLLVN